MAEKTPDTTAPEATPDTTAGLDVKFVRNEHGHIHSVDQAHYDERLTVETARGPVLLPGWEDVDETTARAENPQLFGALDPNVRLNFKEMQDIEAREDFAAKHRADGLAE